MSLLSKLKIIILPLLLSMWMTPAYSVAYCALRDPVNKIYKLFPEATSYRSIVHEIDKSAQQQVKQTVPFSIHQDELGQHTLYIAMKKEKPLGLIHSRSEVGMWGLVEIVWAFNFELNVLDFMFQRCRESSCKLIEKDSFRSILKNKSVLELSTMLKENSIPYPSTIRDNEEAKTLAKTIIRSAIKTALVTKYSWKKDLETFNVE